MGKPDALSRRSDHGTGGGDNDNIVLLRPEFLVVKALTEWEGQGEAKDILKEIRKELLGGNMEDAVAKAASELRNSGAKSVRSAEWSLHNDLLQFRGKIYVPKNSELRRRIVEQHYDSKVAGHPGRWKTLELVFWSYWWPQMSRYVGAYTKTCDMCMRTKTQCRKPHRELVPLAIPEGRWDTISVDFITELPDSNGYDAIMNVVDSAGKRAHFLPTHTMVTALGAARLYLHNVWKLHGLPKTVVSD